MDEDIENISKLCTSWQIHQNITLKASMHPRENSKTPWMTIGKMFLIISGSYSKWLDIMPLNSITTATLTKCLKQSFSTHGLSFVIVNDSGPSFISNSFNFLMEKME